MLEVSCLVCLALLWIKNNLSEWLSVNAESENRTPVFLIVSSSLSVSEVPFDFTGGGLSDRVRAMKLQFRLIALVLIGVMASTYATADKMPKEDALIAEVSQEDSFVKSVSSSSEEAVGDLLLQAISLLGVAYRFGGSSPTTGLDCSGFIRYVFKQSLKVNLPRTSAQMAQIGRVIERRELVPGDLVFFNTRGFVFSHVGIYMGNDKFIHAPRTGKNIEVSNLRQTYWQRHYNGARRVTRNGSLLEANEEETVPVKIFGDKVAAPIEPSRCTNRTKGRKCRQAEVRVANKRKWHKSSSLHIIRKKGIKKAKVPLEVGGRAGKSH